MSWIIALVVMQARLVESAEELGIEFDHFAHHSDGLHLPEIVGSGVGVIDYDNDGDFDLYLVQGNLLSKDQARQPVPDERLRKDQLWRNNLVEKGRLTFTNITAHSKIDATGFGMGVCIADFNVDGKDDIFVTNLGPNQLWINKGEGRFEEAANPEWSNAQWSTSASAFDFNRDGLPDLYITNYVLFNIEDSPKCYAPNSARDYCGPDAYPPARDQLLINQGAGRFKDQSYLLGELRGAGLGVKTTDFNRDGWTDLFVANDGDPNFLLINQQGQGFSEDGMLSGVAVNALGVAEASMGVAMGDYDQDGDDDLFLTHLNGETNTLYENMGDLMFEDRTQQLGLAFPAKAMTGFGTAWVDLNQDGWPDLVNANGAVRILYDQLDAGEIFPLKQSNQIFMNRDGKRFEENSGIAGPSFTQPLVSRGVASVDLENDGDTDILISNSHGPLQVFINQPVKPRHWLGLIIRTSQGLWADGARVQAKTRDGLTREWTLGRDGSYLCSMDPRLLIALNEPPLDLRVKWANGSWERFQLNKIDRYYECIQGKGVALQ